MALIKEPLNVDFYVSNRPMTAEDEKAISYYIQTDKEKRKKKDSRKKNILTVQGKTKKLAKKRTSSL